MKLFSIGYDLDKPGQDYHKLIVELKRLGAKRVLLSQWVMQSNSSCKDLRDHLKAFLDSNDRLLVTEVADWASYRALSSINEL